MILLLLNLNYAIKKSGSIGVGALSQSLLKLLKKLRINLKFRSKISTKTQGILDNCVINLAIIISKVIAMAFYKRVFEFFRKP